MMRHLLMSGFAAHACMSVLAAEAGAAVEDAPLVGLVAEEYASYTISIDHLATATREDGHTVIKVVNSTETATESALSQLAYFGMMRELTDPKIATQIGEATKQAAVIVITPNEALTNVIVDAALMAELMSGNADNLGRTNPDQTVLGAHASLMTLATELRNAAGGHASKDRVLFWISNED